MSLGQSVSSQQLREIYLFGAFDADQLSEMSRVTQRISLQGGERLFNEGDEIRRFFYIESGQIKLYRLSFEGYEKVMDLIGPKQTFAEAVVFMERSQGYPVNAEALMPTRLLGFDAPAFLGLLKQSNESCLKLLGVMSRRLRWQLNEIDRLALHNATSRFVDFIFNPGDEGVSNGKRIELDVPKNVLASRLSIKPETFSRILARLSAAGMIKVEKQAITLLDTEGLRQQLEAPV
ncbi:MAG: Crp/Fnr family transcriptional regulator [Arenicellales bacterium]